MKKLNLTELQRHRIHEALRHASAVLREIKAKPLEGPALEQMKLLEVCVSEIEMFTLGTAR